jgi:crotonobetainyl-CoA:carnitine CoA-transferase CaiB-like acyl-CoA transferase
LVLAGRQAGPAPAPGVGADTDAVLAQLGLEAAEIAELRERGYVA